MYYLLREIWVKGEPSEFIFDGYFPTKVKAETYIKQELDSDPTMRRGHFKILERVE